MKKLYCVTTVTTRGDWDDSHDTMDAAIAKAKKCLQDYPEYQPEIVIIESDDNDNWEAVGEVTTEIIANW